MANNVITAHIKIMLDSHHQNIWTITYMEVYDCCTCTHTHSHVCTIMQLFCSHKIAYYLETKLFWNPELIDFDLFFFLNYYIKQLFSKFRSLYIFLYFCTLKFSAPLWKETAICYADLHFLKTRPCVGYFFFLLSLVFVS